MKLFKDYKWGIDLLGALLVALLLLPNIVYWCIPDFTGLDGNKALSVIGYVFEALGLAATLAIVRKEPQRFSFFSLLQHRRGALPRGRALRGAPRVPGGAEELHRHGADGRVRACPPYCRAHRLALISEKISCLSR